MTRYLLDTNVISNVTRPVPSQALTSWDVEASIVTPEGRIKYTHAIARPERLSDGSVLWTGVTLDATRIKEAEAAAADAARAPWLLFLPPGSVPDSGNGEKNIGFPYEPHEIDGYIKIVRKTCPKVTDAEIELLTKKLKEIGPKKDKE